MKISKVLGTVSGFGSTLSGLYWAGVVRAQDLGEHLPPDPLGGNEDVLELAQRVINLAILLAALVCVVVLIASGYSYITAAGDEQKIEKATKTLTYAIVGLVICFIAVILVQFVLGSVLTPA
jgi:cytochrome bd-type quinol oxidase subunit 2